MAVRNFNPEEKQKLISQCWAEASGQSDQRQNGHNDSHYRTKMFRKRLDRAELDGAKPF